MAKIVNIALRGLQFLWTLLIMSLIGNTIAEHHGHSPSILNYCMFVAAFSMLTLFYLIPVSFKEGLSGHPVIPFTLDLLNTLFTFIGGVALAAYLGVHSCSNQHYLDHNRVTRGAHDESGVCKESQASTAFLWFSFAAFLVSTVFSGMEMTSGGANLGARGVRRNGPAMSQV